MTTVQCNLAPITNRCHTGDNVGMDAGEQLAAEILDTIRLGRDLWVRDQFIEGPDRLERARKALIEKRDACSDADEAAFLTSIICGLEKGEDVDGPRPCETQFLDERRRYRKRLRSFIPLNRRTDRFHIR